MIDTGGQQDYEKMLQDYSEGGGSALEESNKSAQNLKGSLNALSNSWTELVSTFAQTDNLKKLVQLLTKILNLTTDISKVTDGLGIPAIAAGGFGLYKFVKNLDWFCNKNYKLKFRDFLVGLLWGRIYYNGNINNSIGLRF